jgi:PAS domain S-box-containing protein
LFEKGEKPKLHGMDKTISQGETKDIPKYLDYQEMIEKSDIWYWFVDTLGHFLWSSKGVTKILGFLPEESIGKNLAELIPEREKKRVFGFLDDQSSQLKEYRDFEMVYLSKLATEKYCLTSGTPVFTENGEYIGYRGNTKDITDQVQKSWRLEESNRMWDRTQKAAKIGNWENYNLTDTVIYSDEMFRIFELEKPPGPHTNVPFMNRVHPEDRQKVIDADLELQKKAGTKELEFRICFPDGRIKYCKEFLQSMEDDFGEIVMLTGTLQDITEIKKTQYELHKKIKFEHYLGKIAERFVKVEEHENAIIEVLKDIAKLNDADRSYIFEFDWDEGTMSNTYEWCSDRTQPQIRNLQKVPVQVAPYWMDHFKKRKCVIIKDTSTIPESRKTERDILLEQDILSVIACPLYCNGSLWGFFGLDNTHSIHSWNQETMTLIKVFTQIFQNYTEKRLADEKIKNLLNELQILNNNLEQTVKLRTDELNASLQEIQKTQAHFQLALKVSDTGLWLWDFNNDEVPESFSFSKYFKKVRTPSEKVINFEKNSMIRWEASVHPDHWDYVFNEKTKYLEGIIDEYSIDYKIWLDRYNDWRWINSTGVIVSRDTNGSPTLMVGTYKDITTRKENELMLKNAKNSAEKKVLHKTEFLSNLNHELRTPLTIILGNSESLLYSDVSNELKPFLKTINRAALQLLELIEEIVDISKIDEDKVKASMEWINSRDFFSNIYHYHKDLAKDKGIDFDFHMDSDFPETIKTDPKLMKKICNNLLVNAIKFTKEGSVRFTISVDTEKQLGQIRVKDTGIGIPKEKQQMIFERFSQADSSSKRRYGGTGLGLSIAKSAADILNAKIQVESEVNQGSTFILTFNLNQM